MRRLSLAGTRERNTSALSLRRQGDRARSAHDWSAAALAYGQHLETDPKDRAIWIQLGHARKEMGEYGASEAAYRTALEISPRDAETWLHMGHLMKLCGREAEATDHFLRSARLDDNADALSEFTTMRGATITPDQRLLLASVLAERLARRSTGVTISQLVPPPSPYEPPSRPDHGWVDFAGDADMGRWVSLRLVHHHPDLTAPGAILADYGQGLTPITDGTLHWDENNVARISIYTTGLKKVRLVFPSDSLVIDRLSLHLEPEETPALPAGDEVAFVKSLSMSEAAHSAQAPDMARHAIRTQLLAQPFTKGTDSLTREYGQWIRLWEEASVQPSTSSPNTKNPLTISFIVPVYKPSLEFLRSCVDSVLSQTHEHIELCIAVDVDISSEADELLCRYEKADPRVRLTRRKRRGHISAATNTAAALARGEYLVLLDQDDTLSPICAAEITSVISAFPHVKIVYSDEDKLSPQGQRTSPHMKGEFDPLLLLSKNFVCHALALERELFISLGGLRLGYEGAQDHDLTLRAVEAAGSNAVRHIPKVLYHWRDTPGSTASSVNAKPYAERAMLAAVNAHLTRQKVPMLAVPGVAPGRASLKPYSECKADVSAIILHSEKGNLRDCLLSVIAAETTSIGINIVHHKAISDRDLELIRNLHESTRISTTVSQAILADASSIGMTAKSDIILFCDTSASFMDDSFLNRAHAILSFPEMGVLGCRVLKSSNAIDSFGFAFGEGKAHNLYEDAPTAVGCNFDRNRLLQSFSAVQLPLFMKRETFQALGGFNRSMSGLDAILDLCIRARAHGLRVAADPDIQARRSLTGSPFSTGEQSRISSDLLQEDPFYSSNLDLRRVGKLAHPPRR